MSKFSNLLTSTGTDSLKQRAANLEKYVTAEIDKEIRSIEDQIKALDMKIMMREDLGVDSNDSLRPGKDLDPVAWVKNMKDDKLAIEMLKIDLRIMNDLKKEYFGEETKSE